MTQQEYENKIKELEKELNQYKVAFSLFTLNGTLADCIIEVTQNEWNNKILNLFEQVAQKFQDKIYNKLKELKGGK